ncbi:MAG: UDP-N-acetylglucosamine 2-epimerase (non-hydrolyzing) [Pirellula sp.]|jgi:UDP-N-acetylglucosamine 2-epimerase (non-hydrolysing)|nr:UDP-N-acetylglucosamine 2-epimerase (non-hydrolyzing) [Pirellula sp.]
MSERLKLATIVGTRPEIIRLSRVIAACDRYFDHKLLHTGQNYDYELNQIFFDDLQIRRPDIFLEAAAPTAAETIGQIISKSDVQLRELSPDAILVLGDTNSCLAAMAAKRLKIPIFHMEAGNRCFDQRVPEEINRKIVDHISDINMPYSTISRDYLLREGLPPDRVIKTGSPMFEVLQHYLPNIERSDVLSRLGLSQHQYFVVSSHREENIDFPEQFEKLRAVLNRLADDFGLPVIVSTHPRTRKKIEASAAKFSDRISFMKPLGFFDYVHLQIHAKVTLSDSGTISEESSILNFPAINVRNAHERPEGMEETSVMMTGLEWNRISQAMAILNEQSRGAARILRPVEDYSMPNVSEKVCRIITSYTDYVNRVVWSKR